MTPHKKTVRSCGCVMTNYHQIGHLAPYGIRKPTVSFNCPHESLLLTKNRRTLKWRGQSRFEIYLFATTLPTYPCNNLFI
jgi:hypothetical protein